VRRIGSNWAGAFVMEGPDVVEELATPTEDRETRLRNRLEGHLTPEESELLRRNAPGGLVTSDRRLANAGVALRPAFLLPDPPHFGALEREAERSALLKVSRSEMERIWDPSIHIGEAVRAVADLDRTLNLLGERLASWSGRPNPSGTLDETAGDDRSARPGESTEDTDAGQLDPAIGHARSELADSVRSLRDLRRRLEKVVEEAIPRSAPNLSALLGPLLAARLIAQAGSLDRLAKLPASTVQVLGAEKAFFAHLRGRAPPPRHGLLFLHPDLQGAPASVRGKLARALAGKVAIAARLDRAGRPVAPELKAAYEARRTAVRAIGSQRSKGGRPSRRPPLHRTSQDRHFRRPNR
jgi:nucleolar protein 56